MSRMEFSWRYRSTDMREKRGKTQLLPIARRELSIHKVMFCWHKRRNRERSRVRLEEKRELCYAIFFLWYCTRSINQSIKRRSEAVGQTETSNFKLQPTDTYQQPQNRWNPMKRCGWCLDNSAQQRNFHKVFTTTKLEGGNTMTEGKSAESIKTQRWPHAAVSLRLS